MLILNHKWHPEHGKCLFKKINGIQNIALQPTRHRSKYFGKTVICGGNAEGNAEGNAKGNAEGNAGGIYRPLFVYLSFSTFMNRLFNHIIN